MVSGTSMGTSSETTKDITRGKIITTLANLARLTIRVEQNMPKNMKPSSRSTSWATATRVAQQDTHQGYVQPRAKEKDNPRARANSRDMAERAPKVKENLGTRGQQKAQAKISGEAKQQAKEQAKQSRASAGSAEKRDIEQ